MHQFTVQGSLFFGQGDSGTALEIIQSNAYVVNCSLLHNKIGSYRGPIGILEDHIKESDIKLSTHAFVGGALIVNQSNVTLTRSKLENNHANIGVELYLVPYAAP